MIRSPRERFIEDKAQALSHAELCVNGSFVRAVDAALLQYIRDIPPASDAHRSVTNSAKIEGATEFVRVLMTLADPSPPNRKRPSDNLPDAMRP